jgi:hypothetical protein
MNTKAKQIRTKNSRLTCTDFQSDALSCKPDVRICLACFDASFQMRQYTINRHIHTIEKTGVMMPATYQGCSTSSNSHSWAVSHLFQNKGIAAMVKPNVQPVPSSISATFFVMNLRVRSEKKIRYYSIYLFSLILDNKTFPDYLFFFYLWESSDSKTFSVVYIQLFP